MIFRKNAASAQRPHPNPFSDETFLGNVLIKMKVITKEQLFRALGAKAVYDEMLLGALLRELGFASAGQVANALRVQAKMRSGDVGEAAILMMELRLDNFCENERLISEAIEQKRQAQRDRGEESGMWIIPLSPAKEV